MQLAQLSHLTKKHASFSTRRNRKLLLRYPHPDLLPMGKGSLFPSIGHADLLSLGERIEVRVAFRQSVTTMAGHLFELDVCASVGDVSSSRLRRPRRT